MPHKMFSVGLLRQDSMQIKINIHIMQFIFLLRDIFSS